MKTIGLIGGMSWESTAVYYRIINEEVQKKLGGWHSARTILYSVDFAAIEKLQHEGKWIEATNIMIDIAKTLQVAGADFIVICTNTMHKMADAIERSIDLPVLHIVDVTAHKIINKGLRKVGLLGTSFTMEEDFYIGRFRQKHHIDVVVPPKNEREVIHNIIFNELCLSKIKPVSKKSSLTIIDNLVSRDIEGIILGCTELGMLIKQSDLKIPLFDTTRIHARAAVDYALNI